MKVTRLIVRIDEEKCNGCGECVPSCAEGALKIVNGKAKLLAENLCDGLGACLGHCPQGAITTEEQLVEEFDEVAVAAHLGSTPHAATPAPVPVPAAVAAARPVPQIHGHSHGGGCPGSQLRFFSDRAAAPAPQTAESQPPSRLSQWPVQLTLVPPAGPLWQDADVLLAADCVPFAYAGFHEKLLAGKTLAIACPKLDDVQPYVRKLTQIFASNPVRSVTVAIMEVPCCSGLLRATQLALSQSGRTDIELEAVIVGVDGTLREG